MSATLTAADALALEQCIADGGVAVFPADTVYGVACDPESRAAVERLYELKGRPARRPAAVMFFTLELALAGLPALAARERAALAALLPGPVTLLLPNREQRFPLACGPDPQTIGVRVPLLDERLRALAEVRRALLQSSANHSGAPEARRIVDLPGELRDGVDLVLDAGELPGVASTVIDLRGYQQRGVWSVVRAGALAAERIAAALG
ncbi:MAG TPA: Sua5/YciO/YrdC/YwlC family protein [Solirubrobacteraceae bacterium]|nr:Sua5/YciO/YrdC/YwlC family protein [Solirubrobacteraceae bacterium]